MKRRSPFGLPWLAGVAGYGAMSLACQLTGAETPPSTKGPQPMPGKIIFCPAPDETDQEIDKIIRSEENLPAMARKIRVVLERSKGDSQVQASRHLVNLTGDSDYHALIADLLLDSKGNPEVIEVLFADLIHRRHDLQLPILLALLKNRQHPQHQSARKALHAIARTDFGDNTEAWQGWVDQEMARLKRTAEAKP